ncbi:diacylglycerol/lipid kinase family protein [Brevundimonas sp.]|uniref:diacylglycerol/lipid kinase family protein n=1 Tax=Brevundimonas sp. TaxID=1871086 RepID=UPI002ABC7F38|nr:diacylglycerol kinase family protein [Brevundimonas sp.]MDZ4362015.1 diacylglycerol kinase family protein [Brevundimonas sp.]
MTETLDGTGAVHAVPTSEPSLIQPPAEVAERPSLTPHVALKRIIMLVNPLSGSVGPKAAGEAEAILAEYDVDATVVALEGGQFDKQIDDALTACPDVLLVLAGDGTAGTIASRAGPDGPLIAPLPGGTMNMLPKALYGTGDWKVALRRTLEEGAPQPVSGGKVDGQAFYCAAILGAPALWAPAREAVRTGKLKKAWNHARVAMRRAFSGRIRYSLDGSAVRRAEAMVFISPMISRAVDDAAGLEAAAMNTAGASEAFRLAAHALFNDWRHDPAVTTRATRRATVRARSRIPVVIDGEPSLLGHEARITFVPKAFRALAPLPPAAGDSV